MMMGIISSIALVIIFYRIDVGLLLIAYIINTLAMGELLGRKLYKNYLKYTRPKHQHCGYTILSSTQHSHNAKPV